VLADLVCDSRVRKIPRRISGRLTRLLRRTPYADAVGLYKLERRPGSHSAAGRRRKHIGGASSIDADADAVRRYALRCTPYADAIRHNI